MWLIGKQRAKRLWKRNGEGVREKEKGKRGDNSMLLNRKKKKEWSRMKKWSSLERRLNEICSMLNFKWWLVFVFLIFSKEYMSGSQGFIWNSPHRTDTDAIKHFTSRLWNALLGLKSLENWHVYTLTATNVDYQNDLWEQLACLGLGQVYGMSIWGGGWGVTDPHNVRAQLGK